MNIRKKRIAKWNERLNGSKRLSLIGEGKKPFHRSGLSRRRRLHQRVTASPYLILLQSHIIREFPDDIAFYPVIIGAVSLTSTLRPSVAAAPLSEPCRLEIHLSPEDTGFHVYFVEQL